jgi:hypothetical protein
MNFYLVRSELRRMGRKNLFKMRSFAFARLHPSRLWVPGTKTLTRSATRKVRPFYDVTGPVGLWLHEGVAPEGGTEGLSLPIRCKKDRCIKNDTVGHEEEGYPEDS